DGVGQPGRLPDVLRGAAVGAWPDRGRRDAATPEIARMVRDTLQSRREANEHRDEMSSEPCLSALNRLHVVIDRVALEDHADLVRRNGGAAGSVASRRSSA